MLTQQTLPNPCSDGRATRTKPRLEVRLARVDELEAVFRLRYDVFYAEMGASDAVSNRRDGLDVDRYDEFCDHLVVTDNDRIVGTYRLLPLARLKGTNLPPYSAGEFELGPIQARYGDRLLELGRSCVHPDYRTGLVPRMLWAGIARAMVDHDIHGLIGCVSVHGISDVHAIRLAQGLKERGHWHSEFDLPVCPPYAVDTEAWEALDESLGLVPANPFQLMPPLMKGYFNLGARVCGGPAHDEPFHCHDFLILLDSREIDPKYFNSLVKPHLSGASAAGECRRAAYRR